MIRLKVEYCPKGHNRWNFRKTGKRAGSRYCVECERLRPRLPESLERRKEYATARRRHRRMLVILSYGGKCMCCEEARFEFLTIDHINNDGAKHRKEANISSGGSMVNWLIRNNLPEEYQVLCWNCNSVKQYTGYCPHEEGHYA